MSYRALGDTAVDPTAGASSCPQTDCKPDEYQSVFVDLDEPVWCAQYCPEGWYEKENECGKWCFEPVDGPVAEPNVSGSVAKLPDQVPVSSDAKALAPDQLSVANNSSSRAPVWAFGLVALAGIVALAAWMPTD